MQLQERGHAYAAAILGWFYTTGPNVPWHLEVPTDLVEAVKWLRSAVKGDDQTGERTSRLRWRPNDNLGRSISVSGTTVVAGALRPPSEAILSKARPTSSGGKGCPLPARRRSGLAFASSL